MEDFPYLLSVEAVWPSISNKTLNNKLSIYFQNKRKSQGGECVVEFSDQTSSATVYFKSAQIRDQVLAKEDHSITVENQVVKLKVFIPDDGKSQTEVTSTAAGTTSNQAASVVQPVPTETSSVRVNNISADILTNETLLEPYFEKWGGPVESLQTLPEEKAAIITFKSPDAVQKFLTKTDHNLGKQPITVCPYFEKAGIDLSSRPSPNDSLGECSQSSSVVLENLPDNFSREVLVLLVENVSNLSEEMFFTEFIKESNLAVVTFNDPAIAEKFLIESKSHKNFQKNAIMSRPLEKTISIKVENMPDKATSELLDLYFDKCGGPVKEVTIIPEEEAAIVTFHSQEDVEKILGREHHIAKTPVNVYPYIQSLGTALYGKKRPTWALPKPFKEKIHPAVREFLHKKDLIPPICNQMASLFCKVNLDKSEVQISPLPTLLRQKGITKSQIDNWKQNATDSFRNILSNYDVFENAVMPSVWATVEKDIRSVVKDKAFMGMDNGVLTLAGMAQDIKILKPILEDLIQKVSNEMERDKNSVSDHLLMSPAIYSLLLQEGLQKTVMAKHPDLKLNYKKDTNQLTFIGLAVEITDFKNWILERRIKMKEKPLKMDPTLLEFLSSVDCEEMSEDLFTSKGIGAVFRIENGEVVLTGSTDTALRDAEKRLHTSLTFSTLTVEDADVIKKPEWHSLSNRLCDTFNTSKKKTVVIKPSKHGGKVVVFGFKDPVSEVSMNLEKFIDMHSKTEQVIRIRSYAVMKFIQEKKSQAWMKLENLGEVRVYFDPKRPLIRVSGERVQVQPVMENFQKIAEALHTDKLILNKPGAKKFFQEQRTMFFMMIKDRRFVVVLEESQMVEEEEENYNDSRAEDIGQLSCEVKIPGGLVITVRKADICQFKVDAVVNAANEDLQHIGGVALALLTAAGTSLQECSDRYVKVNGKVPPGNAITTEAGFLPCKYVVHTVGPRYYSTDKLTAVKLLRQAVRESLKQAVVNSCSSIALPVISSGIFGFPLELCTETIAKELHAYIEDQKRQRGNTLKKIHIVDNNANTVSVLAQAIRKEFAEFNPKMTFLQPMRSEGKGNQGRGYHGQGYRGHGRGQGGQGNYQDGRGQGGQGNYQDGRGQGGQGYQYGRKQGGQGYRQDGRGHPGTGPRNTEQFYKTHEPMESEHQESTKGQNFYQTSRTMSGDWDTSESLEAQSTQEGLKIFLKIGNIQDESSDVIVNTISENADLNLGAVSKALLQAAGPRLQSEAKSKLTSSKLSPGDILVTDGYNLNCKRVFHTVCPFWNRGDDPADEILKQIITDCLKKAEHQKMASISFPAIGTGNLGFPKELVSKILVREIHDFSGRVSPWFLKEVTVVVHPSDTESVKCFMETFRGGRPAPVTKRIHPPTAVQQQPSKKTPVAKPSQSSGLFGVVSTPTLGKHTVQVGNVTMEVSSGDITRERCEAIVNSSNASFSLKSGVSKAILDAAGFSVEQECAQAAQGSQKDMIVTSGGQLPCRNIIHIPGRNDPAAIKDVVYTVLKICEAQKFSSIAFPALGTGQGGASPSAVADAMIDAVVDFVKKKKVVHLQSVKFLIFQTSMVSDFYQSMMRRQQEGVEEETGVFGWIKEKFNNLISGASPEPSTNEDFVMVGEEFEPAVFQLCGESQEDLSEACELISSFIVKEQLSTSIQDSAINHFSREEAEMLNNLQRELTVSIQLKRNGPEPVIAIEGLTRDVVNAESSIRDMIRKTEKNQARKREVFMISKDVEWHYLDSTDKLVLFDYETNYDLEEAFRNKQRRIKIKIHNEEFEADVLKNVAVGRNKKQTELKRVDLKEQASVALPNHWKDMKGKGFLKVVEIQQGTPEYKDVENEFSKTGLSSNILKIERIQNSTLWKSYTIHKKHFEEKNQHTNNEKKLFHGTSSDTVIKINHQGFNRSFAGQHGTMYGNGVYFAVDPIYSAQGYAKPDAQGHKRMYLARVLVGEYTRGKPGLLSPPAKSSTTTDLYDSVTDNQLTPSMFVIFHDAQAYPEYLITFQ